MNKETGKTLNDYITRCVRLESELAEARKKINSLGGALDETMSTTHYQGKEIDALKAELAEAKKEVERLREALENILNALESDDDCMDIAALHIAEEALFGE